jgi:DNA primase
VATGLLIAPDDGGAPYDRFRDRLIFPIADGRGRVISFGGRALDPAAHAKYLNGPDTSLFDKGRVLFGLAEARRLLHAGGADAPLVVVEGYFDVIACQRAGVAAVACMGASLTENQMEMLWRLHGEPTLSFDVDRAGRQAAARAIDRALPLIKAGRSFRFAAPAGGKDADEVLREQGPAALRARLAETTPLVEALFIREAGAEPLDTPERRAGLRKRLREAARLITEPELRAEYAQALEARFEQRFAAPSRPRGMRGPWPRWREPLTPAMPETRSAARRLARSVNPAAAALARWAVHDPAVLDDHLEALERVGFGDPALQDLTRAIIRLRLDADHLDTATLQRHLAHSGFSALLIDIDRAATHAGAPFIKSDVTLAAARSQWSRAFDAICRLAAVEEALAAAKLGFAAGESDSALPALKGERDQLRRAVEAGEIWTLDESD